jgi:hypothetical protein
MVGAVAGPLSAASSLIDNTQSPPVPANFTTTAGAAGTGVVNFSWSPVPSASTYRLQVKSATTLAGLATALWTTVSSVIGGNISAYTYTGTPGLFYQFQLRAQNPNGTSGSVVGPAIGL